MKADAVRPGRWQHLDSEDEFLLHSQARSGGEMGDLALSAMTHLPLRILSWGWVRSRIENLLAVAETSDRRRYLEQVLRWVPVLQPEGVVDAVFQLPTIDLNRRIRNYVNDTWMQTPAPGCVLLSDAELSLAAARSESRLPELRQLAEMVTATEQWHDADQPPSIDELDPLTVTALWSLLSTDSNPSPAGNNALVAHIAKYSQFRPELRGLFRVYRHTLGTYAKDIGRQLGSWLLDDRDEEWALCWMAWQIAWCVSRGGIANVVAGLRSQLRSSDLEERAAAIALIADAADYSVQSEAPTFGGGAAPERLAPNNPLLIVAEPLIIPPPGSPLGGRRTRARVEAESGIEHMQGGRYVVWFGTNRRPVVRGAVVTGFSAARDHTVHYGWCRVAIPQSHRIGSTGSPWWRRLLTLRDDRLTLAKLVTTSADEHWAQIAKALKRQIDAHRTALVFIHGYNVSFNDAAIRAAQLGFDLGISGAMAFYSWPTRARSGKPRRQPRPHLRSRAISPTRRLSGRVCARRGVVERHPRGLRVG